jgi:hypothetical protein
LEFCVERISNNTAPNGTTTKALQGLTTLSNELAETQGINDPFTDLMENWFGEMEGLDDLNLNLLDRSG